MRRYQAMIQKHGDLAMHPAQRLGAECESTEAAVSLIRQWCKPMLPIERRTWDAWVEESGGPESGGLVCDVSLECVFT